MNELQSINSGFLSSHSIPKLNLPDIAADDTPKKADTDSDVLLMCKDIPVYNITKDSILSTELLPGAILRKTMNYDEWIKSRYSAGSNVTARRLMMRAFGTDNHGCVLKATRALSLSDCYWLKESDENVLFADVTPYLHKEWNGSGNFTGGSIATLFVNGAADKCWFDTETLKKINSRREMEVYHFCKELGLTHISEARLDGADLLLTNFTSMDYFLESMGQSGYIGANDNHLEKSVEIFGKLAVALFVVDYLVEHDDRHSGNFGFLRNTNTGEYAAMAPYYDFDWAWSDGVTPLPANALQKHGDFIRSLCEKAKAMADKFEHGAIILKRADELLGIEKSL